MGSDTRCNAPPRDPWNKDEIQARIIIIIIYFLQVWMHMTTSYRDHKDHNRRLHHNPSNQRISECHNQKRHTKEVHNDHKQDEGSKKPPLINKTPCKKIDAKS